MAGRGLSACTWRSRASSKMNECVDSLCGTERAPSRLPPTYPASPPQDQENRGQTSMGHVLRKHPVSSLWMIPGTAALCPPLEPLRHVQEACSWSPVISVASPFRWRVCCSESLGPEQLACWALIISLTQGLHPNSWGSRGPQVRPGTCRCSTELGVLNNNTIPNIY